VKSWVKAVIKSVAALFGVFPNGGISGENNSDAACQLCLGAENEHKLLEASNNLHMRCPACGRLIKPHS
jgi:PHP family Zn ribbon phosphoesterase